MTPAPDTLRLVIATCESVEAIDGWAEGAAPGDRLDYAAGALAPSKHPGFVRARALYDAKLVDLRQARDGAGWRWWMIRTEKGWPTLAGASAPLRMLSPDQARVLAYCVRQVESRPDAPFLPSNRAIATTCKLRTGSQASHALAKLVDLGLIMIVAGERSTDPRRVELVRIRGER